MSSWITVLFLACMFCRNPGAALQIHVVESLSLHM